MLPGGDPSGMSFYDILIYTGTDSNPGAYNPYTPTWTSNACYWSDSFCGGQPIECSYGAGATASYVTW
jgi:secreted trypsin-like serine protease